MPSMAIAEFDSGVTPEAAINSHLQLLCQLQLISLPILRSEEKCSVGHLRTTQGNHNTGNIILFALPSPACIFCWYL